MSIPTIISSSKTDEQATTRKQKVLCVQNGVFHISQALCSSLHKFKIFGLFTSIFSTGVRMRTAYNTEVEFFVPPSNIWLLRGYRSLRNVRLQDLKTSSFFKLRWKKSSSFQVRSVWTSAFSYISQFVTNGDYEYSNITRHQRPKNLLHHGIFTPSELRW